MLADTLRVPLHSDQPPYSILRPAAKHDVIPWCTAHDVGVISYSPLFRGLLFGTPINNSGSLAVAWCLGIALAAYLGAKVAFHNNTRR
jgi:aryl-alcohol dehydrogenase-like predicted oxidoreductase